MALTGSNFIGYTNSAKGEKSFQAFATSLNDYLPGKFFTATDDEFQSALQVSAAAFPIYSQLSYSSRAAFLDKIAEEIMALGDELITRCSAESGLPVGRITGERGRTCGQLQLFAKLLRDGWWVDARIEKAQPERQPLPKSDIRRMLVPIGPVAVFGASNFPLAFSTAGGDTASALAAGCPVVVKAHSSHPGTNELIASAIIKAAQATGMPEGVFSSLYLSHDHAVKLVEHPAIKAVGFTGSRSVGMILFNAAVNRPDPIPVYAEMSAINPVILFEHALVNQQEKIAKDLAASVTLGAGQFCTNPGLVLLIDSEASQKFLTSFAANISAAAPASMLNKNIYKAYKAGLNALAVAAEISLLASAEPGNDAQSQAHAAAYVVSGAGFLSKKEFGDEIFGPATLVVNCKDEAELKKVLQSMEGQLTATLHATDEDERALASVINIIVHKVGRVIYGGFPTGVEVCHSMQHGGPFPSTSDARSTSVGTAAIYRFVRPVAYQDFPDRLLPQPLQKENPLGILRLINGEWTKDQG
ncbi:MAG: aldehyde dehydrogenase (NADP(+)) [Flavitalea sp.]